MSEEAYYLLEQSGSPNKTMEGLSLPSFPATSYWYDAHSTVGSSLYTGSDGPAAPTFKAQQQVDAKFIEREEEPLELWTEGMCLGNQQRTFDGHYWASQSSKRGYTPPCNDSPLNGFEYEPSSQSVVFCDTQDQELVSASDTSRQDQDDRSMCSESMSSQEYSPVSSHSDVSFNKKHSPEPTTLGDEHKRCQKRQRKESSKDRSKEDKRCGVCGDTARSMHFGGMACDSCKAFFRRSVQSGAYKSFQCPESENCPISKTNRKVCQFCRFKKSQENGMEINWVMSETDRMVLWKNRLAKQRHVQEEKLKEQMYGDLPRALDPDKADTLKNLAAIQETTFNSIPYPEDCYGNSVEALANLFVCICKKLGMFFYKVEDFQEVCKTDQSLLLKNGIGMSIYLHGAYMYDYEREEWPYEGNKEALKIPPITKETLRKFTIFPEAFEAIMKFYNKYGREIKDEIILALICIIAFFQPDDPQFRNPQKIQDIQLKYLECLQHYLKAKEGDIGVKITFPKLLVGLADVKEILEFHSKIDIKPTINHQKISTQSTVKNQISAVNELFQKVTQGLMPEFSSILSASEKRESRWQSSVNVRRKRPSSSVMARGDMFYHPHTNQIFGGDPRTDMIFVNPVEQIERFLRKSRMPVAQISEVSSDSNDDWSVSRDNRRTVFDSEMRRTNSASTIYDPDRQQLRLMPSDKSDSCTQLVSTEKKKAVEVLCDILQHVSCTDNEEFIQSLRQNLAPHLLRNLAQKLSSSYH